MTCTICRDLRPTDCPGCDVAVDAEVVGMPADFEAGSQAQAIYDRIMAWAAGAGSEKFPTLPLSK